MRSSTSSIRIDAPAARVWDALVNPAKVKRWQYGAELDTTWERGTPIRFTARWGDKILEQWGTVLEFDPCRALKYSLFAPRPGLVDRPENYFRMTYALVERDGATELSILQDDPRAETGAPPGDREAGHAVLQALKDLVEKGG